LEDLKMTVFYSYQDKPRGLPASPLLSSWRLLAKRLRALTCGTISRTGAALRIIHQGIVTAKARRLQRELMFHTASRHDRSLQRNSEPNQDAAKFPQRPLILGDKWDF
jgi:hypothetical protein